MIYRHRFWVRASVEAVARFHSQTNSMAAITPPPIVVRVHQAPEQVHEGAGMDFTLWLGPLPLRWRARFEAVCLPGAGAGEGQPASAAAAGQEVPAAGEAPAAGFIDRQMAGPFKEWVHRHTFRPAPGGRVEVLDEVRLALRPHPLWGPVGLGMALGLPALFAFRAWKTRRLLEGG